jgi:hypothetical protein
VTLDRGTLALARAQRLARVLYATAEDIMADLASVPAGSPRYWALYGEATELRVEADRARQTLRLRGATL